jgi:hypothetical protein
MKKFRLILPAVAFVIAIGSAFASSLSPLTQGYIKVTNPLQPCQTSVQCNNTGAICKDASNRDVFDGSVMSSTSCGTALLHQP